MSLEDQTRWRLMEGETIIWSGRPGQGIMVGARDIFLIPFSLMFCGFAIFWETQVFRLSRSPFFFKLWGIPFILVGLFLVIGRFLLDAGIRRGMQYAVTNQRLLISRPWPFRSMTSLAIDRLPEVRMTEGRNGTGTIAFGAASSIRQQGGFAAWSPALDPVPQFIEIPDVAAVFGLIRGSPSR